LFLKDNKKLKGTLITDSNLLNFINIILENKIYISHQNESLYNNLLMIILRILEFQLENFNELTYLTYTHILSQLTQIQEILEDIPLNENNVSINNFYNNKKIESISKMLKQILDENDNHDNQKI